MDALSASSTAKPSQLTPCGLYAFEVQEGAEPLIPGEVTNI